MNMTIPQVKNQMFILEKYGFGSIDGESILLIYIFSRQVFDGRYYKNLKFLQNIFPSTYEKSWLIYILLYLISS
ncbi:hypothetical protein ABD77_14445 [Brevibacillus formosus]|nr:hypothetical protein [Brevibacillus formosus]